MDPAVVAALIAVPTAVVAATAAYAAGRAQAHGAHRGPVDAVRREAQREAYLAFVTAARSFSRDDRIPDDLEALRETCAAVELEGPKRIADLARHVVSCAESHLEFVRLAYSTRAILIRQLRNAAPSPEVLATYLSLVEAVQGFTDAARDHLNGEGA
ncbi:hypothetical protein [Streptomyces sp. NPDC051219]|uniref:hypothetical protein n=1 Tax=Streptomyces sp. NPDC051219 TaxID=3155283 RepID=UPI003427C9B0